MCFCSGIKISKSWLVPALVISLLFFSSCSTTKYVPENDYLLKKNQFELKSDSKVAQKTFFEQQLAKIATQRPNRRAIGIPYALMFYNLFGKKKSKGVFKNFTEAPALFSEADPEKDKLLFKNHLHNLGFFHSEVVCDTIVHNARKKSLRYTLTVGQRNRIKTYKYERTSNFRLDSIIEQDIQKSPYVKVGANYNLYNLKAERVRISKHLRDNGFYFFNPELLFFQADTLTNEPTLHLRLKVNRATPAYKLAAYQINSIKVHYGAYSGAENIEETQEIVDGVRFLGNDAFVRPSTVKRSLAFQNGDFYAETKHDATQGYLQNMGIVNSANLSFAISDSTEHKLECNVYLSRAKRFNVSTAIDASLKSIGFAGPGARLNFVDNDAFGGGNRFSAYVNGQMDFQIEPFAYEILDEKAYELSEGISLEVPSFVSLFGKKFWQRKKASTIMSLNNRLHIRPRYYELASLNGTLGYRWKPDASTTKTWNFLDVSYYYLEETTARFQAALEERPVLERSFENQLFVGSSFVAEKSEYRSVRDGYRWMLRLEAMGNLLNLFYNLNEGRDWENEPPNRLWDIEYAQYVLFESDFSSRRPINYRSAFAFRLGVGVGIPLGNSSVLPYTKQFFVGGANSVRAFKMRSLGPGGTPINEQGYFVEQTGDLKIDMNIEYRLNLDRLFEIAVFADAGNVWLMNSDRERPLANFELDRFWKEFAVGIGFGVRINMGYVVIRTDAALPLRHPGLPAGNRWTFMPSNLHYGEWDPRLQVTVGYPF